MDARDPEKHKKASESAREKALLKERRDKKLRAAAEAMTLQELEEQLRGVGLGPSASSSMFGPGAAHAQQVQEDAQNENVDMHEHAYDDA